MSEEDVGANSQEVSQEERDYFETLEFEKLAEKQAEKQAQEEWWPQELADTSELHKRFPAIPKKCSQAKKGSKSPKKFNIRIRREDTILLDEISEAQAQAQGIKITRSDLLNKILYDIVHDALMSWKDDDARVFLAKTADAMVSYDELSTPSTPWVNDAISEECSKILNNLLKYSSTHGKKPPGVGFENSSEETYRSKDFLRLRDKLAETDPLSKTVGRSREGFLIFGPAGKGIKNDK